MSLRQDLIRVAHEHPEVRAHLLPILRKQGSIEGLVSGPIGAFDAAMTRFAEGLKKRILAVLTKLDPEEGWRVGVSFFYDEWYSLRVEVYGQKTWSGINFEDGYNAVGQVLGISGSQVESAEKPGAFNQRHGASYEFGIQHFPGVVSSSD